MSEETPEFTGYSGTNDIRLGDIPLPYGIDKAKLVKDAADEIDSFIGFRYQTPINMNENGPVARPARLLLKRISSALTTGRIVIEAAASAEDNQLHAYGARLLREAHEALRSISKGDLDLDGATPMTEESERVRGPLIYNEDPRSNVEAFYDFFDSRNRRLTY